MAKTDYPGIDYGLGSSNVDPETLIRFGVIPQGDVGQAWYDDSKADYGDAKCPKCGDDASRAEDVSTREEAEFNEDQDTIDILDSKWFNSDKEFYCFGDSMSFDAEDAFPEEALGYSYEGEGYKAHADCDGDIFVLKSPYFTRAEYCSPCAPGAGYLMGWYLGTNEETYNEEAATLGFPRVYCFGHEWFEDGVAPYPVFSVGNGMPVYPKCSHDTPKNKRCEQCVSEGVFTTEQ